MVPVLATAGKFVYNNRKPIGYVIGAALALYFSYRVYKMIFPGGLLTDPTKPKAKITNSRAATIAERLFEAMRYSGTKETPLFAALTDLNHNDFIKVFDAFGKRSYVKLTGSAPLYDFLGDDLDLVQWLIQEMMPDEMIELRKILPEIF